MLAEMALTVGGATVGLLIGFRAQVSGTVNVVLLTVAALAYAAVTGICVYVAGRVQGRISDRGRELLDRVAGLLLVAIAALPELVFADGELIALAGFLAGYRGLTPTHLTSASSSFGASVTGSSCSPSAGAT